MSHKTFIDYDGPTGLFVATGEKILPLDSVEGISAVAQSAMLTSLGIDPRGEGVSGCDAALARGCSRA